MRRDEPATPAIEIILPDGRIERPERRSTPAFRPYPPLNGGSPGLPVAPADRRRRRRAAPDQGRGRRLDLES